MWKTPLFFWIKKCFILIFSPLLLISKKCVNHFCRETANGYKNLKKTKILIFNWYLIRQSFQGYSCKSGIAIFAWRVTKNYVYSPIHIFMVKNVCSEGVVKQLLEAQQGKMKGLILTGIQCSPITQDFRETSLILNLWKRKTTNRLKFCFKKFRWTWNTAIKQFLVHGE